MKQGWQDQKVHKQVIIASYYTSLYLLFSTIVHLLIMFVEFGVWEIFMQVAPQFSRWFGFISFDSIALLLVIFVPSKSKHRDVQQMRLSLVCVLFDPAIPTSFFNFIQLFLYLLLFFFNALSVIYQCHLTWFAHNFSVQCGRWEVPKFAK